ncbi:MAG: phosphate ABC transporter substrate-binding protein [Clostridia bacterium]|nr:phosphate ABC transporter substrate-binding protein [Clostridia bacterium]MBR2724155.1 phosphate ABC transporter substrate-binding protein [Ruminococcus sp.]MBR2884264.1 phosphate ABC transporter substrate-binding protein [Clostridia bacterium]MBR3869446.1 phosphate ABC transporter substrate-binding protein [Clostridia bacterium]MBR3993827.1 phosphate ABC transporter substrate-binding protein [Clostridia bacterium]
MKKIISLMVVAVLLVAALAGCGTTNTDTPKDNGQVSGTVSTDGSTSMEKVIGFLSEAYMEENSAVKVTYNPTGSGSGIKAVQAGSCDIGLASRDLKPEEATDLNGTVVAIDGIAMIVNKENPVKDLTIEQIAALYKGEITNWSEVGGADAPVVLIGREAASGTRDGFESITDTEDACKYNQELTSTGDVVQTVSSNPNAIGYASLASVKDTVKLISVEGVTPSTETIQNGSYKIQRNFVMVTKKNAELSPAAKSFFEFATSSAADEWIIEAGAVPVKR